MFKGIWTVLLIAACVATAHAAKTLDIYFIDVEGGQSTLIVTPSGQSLLVDAGFTGTGFSDPSNRGRDPRRILSVLHKAGVKKIDFLLITHFHEDHDGGVPDLAKKVPIDTFIDHGNVQAEAEKMLLEPSRRSMPMQRCARRGITWSPNPAIAFP